MSYEPDADEVPVHRHDGRHDIAYFSLGTNYGNRAPHFYVTLDENGGERSWWLEPERAEALGKRLVEFALDCTRRNDEEALRRDPSSASHPKDP